MNSLFCLFHRKFENIIIILIYLISITVQSEIIVTRVNSQANRRVNSNYIPCTGSYSGPVTRMNSQANSIVNSDYISGTGSYSGPVTRVNSQANSRVNSNANSRNSPARKPTLGTGKTI